MRIHEKTLILKCFHPKVITLVLGETMAILDENTKNEVSKRLGGVKSEVTLVYFDKKTELNEQIKALLTELSGLSDRLKLEVHELGSDAAEKYGVSDGPVTIFKSEHVKGDARFYGLPAGSEFATILEAIKLAGGELKPNDEVKKFFDSTDGVKLEVFVTPQCPHCPVSAYVALKFAMLSEKVKGYAYEAMEFRELVGKYKVRGVPKTVINEGKGEDVGGYPEDVAFLKIKQTLSA
jgi:glutaredoxin-like protein